MTDYLDHYCERMAPGLWGEPFNLLSNFAFLIAAAVVWRIRSRRRRGRLVGPPRPHREEDGEGVVEGPLSYQPTPA